MSRLRSRVLLAVGVSSLLLTSLAIADTTVATSTTEPEPGAVEILPPDESCGGATLGEWGARWWQWAESAGASTRVRQDRRTLRRRTARSRVLPATSLRGTPFSDCVGPRGHSDLRARGQQRLLVRRRAAVFGRNEEELQACLDELPFVPAADGYSGCREWATGNRPEAYWARSPMFTLNVPEGPV